MVAEAWGRKGGEAASLAQALPALDGPPDLEH